MYIKTSDDRVLEIGILIEDFSLGLINAEMLILNAGEVNINELIDATIFLAKPIPSSVFSVFMLLIARKNPSILNAFLTNELIFNLTMHETAENVFLNITALTKL